MKPHSIKTADFKESIFATMSQLANTHQAINLSQGFPDFDCDNWIKELASKAIKDGHNQYAPSPGVIRTREAISHYYQRFYQLTYHPQNEITVTCGATEAIYTTITALINPGDEVIIFEPFYDSYLASIKLAGGIPVPVTLSAPEFNLNKDELSQAFSSKTKLVILNNPHNPTGKVYSCEELLVIADLVIQHDAYLLSDEVYEFLTYDGANHFPIAKLAGMQERTLTISSMGKTFGVTGWKIGWIAASPELTHSVRMVHQFNVFSVSTPFQLALADSLESLEKYLPEVKNEYQAKKDYFYRGLEQANFRPIHPTGAYFIMGQIDHLSSKNDVEFCIEMIKQKKVAAIPPSPFYLKSQQGQKLIRFCFAKKMSTLELALERLQQP